MRQDPTKDQLFATSELWDRQRYRSEYIVVPNHIPDGAVPGRKFYSHSLSGSERNRLFLQRQGNFEDLSLISGADDLNDGRSFSMLDYDGDGWQDVALMSLNAPRFKLYRNQLGDVFPDRRSFRFQLEGGQTDASPSSDLSNRDGIGAKVLIEYSDGSKMMMHRQAGEGYASQNSQVMSVGIPDGTTVSSVSVQWPSGKATQVGAPGTEEILKLYEVK